MLWASDGTGPGTSQVPGEAYNPIQFTNVAGTLFFEGGDTTHGNELWKAVP